MKIQISQQKGYCTIAISAKEKSDLNLAVKELRIRKSRQQHYLVRLPKFGKKKNFLQPLIKLYQIESTNQWFGKLPDSDDLIYLNCEDLTFNLFIFKTQWKYRLLLITMLSERAYVLNNNNLIQLP